LRDIALRREPVLRANQVHFVARDQGVTGVRWMEVVHEVLVLHRAGRLQATGIENAGCARCKTVARRVGVGARVDGCEIDDANADARRGERRKRRRQIGVHRAKEVRGPGDVGKEVRGPKGIETADRVKVVGR
jgi:hypothetical protein